MTADELLTIYAALADALALVAALHRASPDDAVLADVEAGLRRAADMVGQRLTAKSGLIQERLD